MLIIWLMGFQLVILAVFVCLLTASLAASKGKPLYGREWRRHHRLNNLFAVSSIGVGIAITVWDFTASRVWFLGFVQLATVWLLIWVHRNRIRNFWVGVSITHRLAEEDLIRRLEEGP